MNFHSCPACGARLGVPEEQTVVRCRGCGLTIDLSRVAEGQAVADLLASVEGNQDLPGALRFKIGRLLRDHLRELDGEALTASFPREEPPPEPEPVPAGPPPLPEKPDRPAAPPAAPPTTEPTPGFPVVPVVPMVPVVPAAPREPSLWSRLGPAFTENILFALAAFLLVAGAVYFVTTAWTTMTGEQRLLVVVGGLELLGGVLYTAGRILNRGGSLPEVERVLGIVVCFMVPVAAAAAGELLTVSPLLGGLAALAVLGPGFLLARDLGRVSDPALRPVLPFALIGLAALVLLAPTGEESPALATFAGTLALVFACRTSIRGLAPRLGPEVAPALWSTLLLVFAGVVFTGVVSHAAWRFGLPSGRSLPPLGILLSGLSVVGVMLEGALARAGRFASGRSATLLVGAMGLAVAGVFVALANEPALLAAALLGAGGALVAGYRLPAPALLVPGLILAGLAWLKLPAPVREFAVMVRDEAADRLGYRPERLPFAWYGVTFLPYVALCGLAGGVLARTGEKARARVVLMWTLLAATGLCAQAVLMCRGDFRAPAAVFLAEGAMLLILARSVKDRFFVGAGLALVYGGLGFFLERVEATGPTAVLAMSIAGLGALIIARRLRRSGDGFHRASADTLTDLTVVMALAVAAFRGLGLGITESGVIRFAAAEALDVPATLLLSFLLTLLGGIYRRPEGPLLAILLLARGLTGAMNAIGLEPWGDWRTLVFGAGSALPLLVYRMIPRVPDRRELFPELDPTLLVPAGIVVLQVIGAAGIVGAEAIGTQSVAAAAGLLAGAAVLVAAALVSGQGFVTVAAVLQVFLAGPVVAGALGFWMPRAAMALAAAVGLAAVRGGAILTPSRERTRRLIQPFLTGSIAPLAGIILVWLALLLLNDDYRSSTGYDGVHLGVAALITAVAARLTARPEALRVAVLILPLAAIGLLDQAAARADLYPLALLLAAGIAAVWSDDREFSLIGPLIHLSLAFALTTILAFDDRGSPGILFLTFLVLIASGRLITGNLPVAGSLMMLVSALIGFPVVFFHRGMGLDPEWQPFVLMLFTTAALLAPRFKAIRMHRGASRGVAIPFIAAAGVVFIVQAVWVLALQPPTADPPADTLLAQVLATAAFVAAVASLGRAAKLLPFFALALFFHVLAPVNILIEGSYARFWRPDVEVALVGLLLAFTVPADREKQGLTPYVFAGPALLLTTGDLRHFSTPLTVLVATAVAVALLVRTGRRVHADLAGNGLIATAFAFVVYAVPESGRPMPEILTILSTTAAALLIGLLVAARRLSLTPDREWAAVAAERLRRAAAPAAGLAILCAVLNVILLNARPAEADLTLLVAFAMVTVAVVAVRSTMTDGPAHLVHASTAALLVLYAFLAARTGVLSLLEGYHLHALAVIGAGLISLARGRLRAPFTIEGLVLPIPVVLLSLTALVGIDGSVGRAASGFFLAGAVCGLAAHRLRLGALWGVAGVLLNLALFSIWRYRGVVDPAFFGVPPGLSFLVAAELLRRRISASAHLEMFVLGAVLLYGSVGIQVLRVEEPTHALALFALGIVSVVLGFLRRRNEFLVAGTSVVVLDVVAYLARHGFEEGFLGAALLILAGLTVLTVATLSTLRRKKGEGPTPPGGSEPSEETNNRP